MSNLTDPTLTAELHCSFDDAVAKVIEACAGQGFGNLTKIETSKVIKEKLGEDIDPYVILGVCSPRLAHQAIQAEGLIGLLLPCNVVVRQKSDSVQQVAIQDPQSLIALTGNPKLEPVAAEAKSKLQLAIKSLG